MASLVLADELQAVLRDAGEGKSKNDAEPTAQRIEEKLVSVIDLAVERIETVSRQLS